MALPKIIATPGQEAEFRAAAEEYRAAEEALKAAYKAVSEAKVRRRQATDRLARYASISLPGGHLSECGLARELTDHCTCDDDSPEWTTS